MTTRRRFSILGANIFWSRHPKTGPKSSGARKLPGLGDAHQRGGISPPRDADYVEFTWDAAVVNQRREIVASHGS
jgi:hypothetical protein